MSFLHKYNVFFQRRIPLIHFPSFSTAEGTFKFSDGTSLAISGGSLDGGDATWATYSAWKTNQPSATSATRQNQDCVRTKTALWDDVACGGTKQYACQMAATPAGCQSKKTIITDYVNKVPMKLIRS